MIRRAPYPTFGSHNAMTIARISRLAALSPLLIESLRKQGVEFEQIVIPDEVHDLILYRNLLTVFEATDDFLHRHLIRSQEQR